MCGGGELQSTCQHDSADELVTNSEQGNSWVDPTFDCSNI